VLDGQFETVRKKRGTQTERERTHGNVRKWIDGSRGSFKSHSIGRADEQTPSAGPPSFHSGHLIVNCSFPTIHQIPSHALLVMPLPSAFLPRFLPAWSHSYCTCVSGEGCLYLALFCAFSEIHLPRHGFTLHSHRSSQERKLVDTMALPSSVRRRFSPAAHQSVQSHEGERPCWREQRLVVRSQPLVSAIAFSMIAATPVLPRTRVTSSGVCPRALLMSRLAEACTSACATESRPNEAAL